MPIVTDFFAVYVAVCLLLFWMTLHLLHAWPYFGKNRKYLFQQSYRDFIM